MKVVAFVPMKLNNDRLPGKNTKPFTNGNPLCTYILNTLIKINNIDEVYVFCSNDYVKKFMPENVKFLRRSTDLDTSSTSINEVINAFINEVDADVYVLTHATAPFVNFTSIQDAVDKVKSDKYDSAFSVLQLNEFLWDSEKPLNYELNNIPRTQDLEPYFAETSSFYIFKKEIATKYNQRIGFKPYLKVIDKIEGIDIDDASDFNIADAIYNFIIKR